MSSETPIDFAYNEYHPESGEDINLNPIIYVHGLTACKELWHYIPQRIANATKRLSYAYDARNHGDTVWTNEYDHVLAIEDLKAFMTIHSIKKAIIVGHSSGGYTVSMFALKYPDLTEMIINEDMTIHPKIIEKHAEHVLYYIKKWHESVKTVPPELDEAEAVIHAFHELYHSLPLKKGLEEKHKLYGYNYPIKRTPTGYDVKHNMNVITKYLENPLNDSLKEIDGVFTGPAYFMMAEESGLQENLTDYPFERQFPSAVVESIPNITHNIHLRDPEVFIERFLDFYNRHFNPSNE